MTVSSYVIPRTQEQAVAMIKNPVGPSVPYDFKSVEHLIGLLGNFSPDDGPIVDELRDIVTDVLSERSITPVSINSNRLKRLDAQIWDITTQFDGTLTLTGVADLATFLQGVLRAKYVQIADGKNYQYPIFVPSSSL